ncbi:MAG: ketoacyl-ACP synthase III [Myxococcales bacterium]|nr:ketoacyl-ACP synthase III [Myxococcales bacterium]
MTSVITGLGMHLPERCVTNEELGPQLGLEPDWIESRSGIRQRRFGEPAQATSDLGVLAARDALADAGVAPSDVDMIVFATLSPDHEFPGSGFFLQSKMGLRGVPVHDVRAQCSGFLYGLSLADRAIRCGDHRCVLVVGAEMHSKGLDFSPEGGKVSMLFGDGAGAVVVQDEHAPGALATVRELRLHADGHFAEALWIPAPGTGLGTAHRLTPEMIERKLHLTQMDGSTVFMHAVAKMTQAIHEALQRLQLTVQDVDLFVLHQANLRIVQRVAEALGAPGQRFFNTIAQTANTTAASLPIGLAHARQAGALKPGMRVMTATFGAGFTWATGVLELPG